MVNISWLESIALMTDHDREIDQVLKTQSIGIMKAYQSNDQAALRAMFDESDRLACKNTIFQL